MHIQTRYAPINVKPRGTEGGGIEHGVGILTTFEKVKFPVSQFPTLRKAKVGCTPQIASNFPTLDNKKPTQGAGLRIKFLQVANLGFFLGRGAPLRNDITDR